VKKLILVLAVLLITSPAFASHCRKCPAGPQGEQGIQGETGVQGEKGDTGEKHFAYGPGIDVMLYQTKDKNIGIETQYRYDVGRDAHSAYAVVKVNLWEKLQK
jgi:hypothetical protein